MKQNPSKYSILKRSPKESALMNLVQKTTGSNSKVLTLSDYCETEDTNSFKVITDALVNPEYGFTSFSMVYSAIPYEGAEHIATAITHPNNNVETLNFSNTNIAVVDAFVLAQAFTHPNSKVVFLNLANGFMGVYSMQSIATALVHPNCKVSYLNLSHSLVGQKGAEHLAAALANQNCRLVYLNLDERSSFTGRNGYSEITESLKSNFYLLYLSNVNTTQAAAYIKRNQEQFTSNCRLVLDGGNLSEADRVMVLTQCQTLMQIDPVIQGISKEEMQTVVGKLRELGVNPLLRSIPSAQLQNHLAAAAPISLTEADKPSVTYDAEPSWQQQTGQAKTEGTEVLQVS